MGEAGAVGVRARLGEVQMRISIVPSKVAAKTSSTTKIGHQHNFASIGGGQCTHPLKSTNGFHWGYLSFKDSSISSSSIEGQAAKRRASCPSKSSKQNGKEASNGSVRG